MLGSAIDAADIYFQSSRLESWVLEDGIIKEGSHNIEQGAGIRAISGEKTGFAYSDELQFPALIEAARAARSISQSGQPGQGPGQRYADGASAVCPDQSTAQPQ